MSGRTAPVEREPPRVQTANRVQPGLTIAELAPPD
jgi:hypothetical protein